MKKNVIWVTTCIIAAFVLIIIGCFAYIERTSMSQKELMLKASQDSKVKTDSVFESSIFEANGKTYYIYVPTTVNEEGIHEFFMVHDYEFFGIKIRNRYDGMTHASTDLKDIALNDISSIVNDGTKKYVVASTNALKIVKVVCVYQNGLNSRFTGTYWVYDPNAPFAYEIDGTSDGATFSQIQCFDAKENLVCSFGYLT